MAQEQADRVGVSSDGSEHERREALPVARLHRCAALQQHPRHLDAAPACLALHHAPQRRVQRQALCLRALPPARVWVGMPLPELTHSALHPHPRVHVSARRQQPLHPVDVAAQAQAVQFGARVVQFGTLAGHFRTLLVHFGTRRHNRRVESSLRGPCVVVVVVVSRRVMINIACVSRVRLAAAVSVGRRADSLPHATVLSRAEKGAARARPEADPRCPEHTRCER
eukprot:813868-Rhodomonas_salina.1